jgi:hypothetical protein
VSINWDRFFDKPDTTTPTTPTTINFDRFFEPKPQQELRAQPPEVPKAVSFISKYIASPIAGAVTGLTSIPTKGLRLPFAIPGTSYAKPLEKQTQLPESPTLKGVGRFVGETAGILSLENLARKGAVKWFGKGAFTAGAKVLSRSQQLKILTPLAAALGAKKGIESSVTQTYEKGYFDPLVVGEEVALSTALTYVFPAASQIFAKGLKVAATKVVPEILRNIPAQFGGPAIMGAREVSQQMIERFRPLSIPTVTLRHLSDFAQNPRWGPTVNRIGRGLEAWPRVIAYALETPVSRWKDVKGQETSFNAPRLFTMAEQVAKFIKLPGTTEEATGRTINIGGGMWGRLWKNEVANQLEQEYTRLQGSPYRRMAWVWKTSANILRRDDVSNKAMDRLIARLEWGIAHGPYKKKIETMFGTNEILTKPGELLAYIKEMAILKKSGGGVARWTESFLRKGLSHVMLGMGNIASAATLLSRVNIPLTSDGPEATAAMMNEIRDNTAFYQKILKATGLIEPLRGLGVSEPSKIGAASFSLYRKSEQVIMPLIAGARYFRLIKSGASHVDAMKAGIEAVRQVRTALDYDLPSLLRKGGPVGSGLRVALQYFPFALKTTQYASSLGLGQFMDYVGYTFSIAGLKGVPFAMVADNVLAFATGHSIINSLMADPDFAKVLRGIPGIAANIDIGARHNWSQSLVDRLAQPGHGPWLTYGSGLKDALSEFYRRQDGFTTIQLFKAAAPMEVRYILNALDAEKHGAILDAASRPLVKKPTEQELTATAMGFTPVAVSQQRALQAEAAAQKAPRQRDIRTLETEYRRAVQSNDAGEIRRVTSELRKLGLKTQDFARLRKEVTRQPAERIIRGLPKQLRPGLQDLKRRFIESQSER